MSPFETIHIDTHVAACDGGGGVAGHPKVFLNLSASGRVECPYCSRLFIYGAGHANGPSVVTAGAAGDLQARPGDQPPPTAPANVPGLAASPATTGAASSSSSLAKP
jgi:uncharacterized Zn-finger protein